MWIPKTCSPPHGRGQAGALQGRPGGQTPDRARTASGHRPTCQAAAGWELVARWYQDASPWQAVTSHRRGTRLCGLASQCSWGQCCPRPPPSASWPPSDASLGPAAEQVLSRLVCSVATVWGSVLSSGQQWPHRVHCAAPCAVSTAPA